MNGAKSVNLQDLIGALGPQHVQSILSDYSCPVNPDIEDFLRRRAVDFAAQGIAQTHLVLCSEGSSVLLVGFFSLTNKVLTVRRDDVSKTMFKRFCKYGVCDDAAGAVNIAVPLIAQLGKNYAGGCDLLVSGDDLLAMACDKVSAIQKDLGGRLVYLECEDTPALVSFYEGNGFRRICPTGGTGGLLQYIRRSS